MLRLARIKRPLRKLGAAFAFALLAGCAGPGVVREDNVVELRLGSTRPDSAPATAEGDAPLNGPALRVLLRKSKQGLKLAAAGGLRLRREDGTLMAQLAPQGRARLGVQGRYLSMNDKSLGQEQAVVSALKGGEDVRVAGRRYRGRLLLRAYQGQLLLINVVGSEDYLQGVLPSEVPASWPLEALKAQAVAARTFAYTKAQKSEALPYDLDDSTASQVYGGMEGERPRPSEAVEATRGLVLTWRNALAETFFHSNSGGHTADASEVWGGKAPAYLLGVMDSDSEDQQHYAWNTVIPREQAEKALVRAGLWKGFLEDVVGRERSDSGRWASVELLGRGSDRKVIKGSAFRTALGGDRLRSTNFRVHLRGDDLIFDGLGWGHGVGMAQEGAFALARDGHNFRAILDHYYPGTRLARTR